MCCRAVSRDTVSASWLVALVAGGFACSEAADGLSNGVGRQDMGPDLRPVDPEDIGSEDRDPPSDGGLPDLGLPDGGEDLRPPPCLALSIGGVAYEVVRMEPTVQVALKVTVDGAAETPDAPFGLVSGVHNEVGSVFRREEAEDVEVVEGSHTVRFRGRCSEDAPCGRVQSAVVFEAGQAAELDLVTARLDLQATLSSPDAKATWVLFDEENQSLGQGDFPAQLRVLAGRYFIEARGLGSGTLSTRLGPFELGRNDEALSFDLRPSTVRIRPMMEGAPLVGGYRILAAVRDGPIRAAAEGSMEGATFELAPGSYDFFVSAENIGNESTFPLIRKVEVGTEPLTLNPSWDVQDVELSLTGTEGGEGALFLLTGLGELPLGRPPLSLRLPVGRYDWAWGGYCEVEPLLGGKNCGRFIFSNALVQGGRLTLDAGATLGRFRVLDPAGNHVPGEVVLSQAEQGRSLIIPVGGPPETGTPELLLPPGRLEAFYAPTFGSPFGHAISLGTVEPQRAPETEFRLGRTTIQAVLFVGEAAYQGTEGGLAAVSVREGTPSSPPEASIGVGGRFQTVVSGTSEAGVELWYEPPVRCRPGVAICVAQRIQRCEPN
ncbi:MAG: hypothetical protein AAGD10_17575 [Myxococcota bacterium]